MWLYLNVSFKSIDYEKVLLGSFCDVLMGAFADGAGKGLYDSMNDYWIGFYDENAPAYAGKTRFSVSTYEGMCSYKFNTFYRPSDIDNLADLEIQEKLLGRMNWLLDEGIVKIDGLEIKKNKEEIEQEY